LFPWSQRILVNTDLVKKSGNDISPHKLVESLPMYDEGAFEVTYKNYSDINTKLRGERAILQ